MDYWSQNLPGTSCPGATRICMFPVNFIIVFITSEIISSLVLMCYLVIIMLLVVWVLL